MKTPTIALATAAAMAVPAAATLVEIGNDPNGVTGSVDGWSAMMVVDETSTYTNTSGANELVTPAGFDFQVGANRGRVTPFLVKVNGDNNFTVVAVGKTRVSGTDYNTQGVFEFDFSDAPAAVTLAPGEKLAPGMTNANPDGSGVGGSVIPFVDAHEIWLTGGNSAGQVSVGSAPVSGSNVGTGYARRYAYSIEVDVIPESSDPPTDITYSGGQPLPGMAAGAALGTFSAVDPNPGDAHTFSLVANPGNLYSLTGATLQTAAPPGAVGSSVVIRVRAEDLAGNPFEKDFTVTVETSVDPTAVTLDATEVDGAAIAGAAVGTLGAVDANAADQFTFSLVAGAGDADNALFDITGSTLRLAAPVPAMQASVSVRLRATDLNGGFVETAFVLPVAEPSVIINEFLAINDGGLEDEDGDDSDWVEIYNAGAFTVDLQGWYLTDDPADLTKWQFPAVSVPAVGYLVVFASDKNRAAAGSELHTNFKLSGGGEYLALVMPDGVTVASEFAPAYPAQQSNVSYGFFGAPAVERPLFPPTPGAANLALAGPIILDLTENPDPVPGDGDPIVVTAAITANGSPVTGATLFYRVMFGAEVALAMADTGGGLYTATIPASASAPGEMVRWYVTADDGAGDTGRAPLFLDPTGSPKYHGTAIADPSVVTGLPVMQRFLENPAGTENRSGTRGAFFYNGEFYDNIFSRIRGGTSANWPKKSYKIDFNDGHHFRFRAGVPRVDEINLNTTYTDKSYVRAVLAYEHQRDAGLPSPEAFFVHFRQNGAFWNVAILVEQPDRDYLSRWDLDPDGALYKGAISPTHYEPGTPLSRWEKKTRLHEGKSDLDAFIDGIAQTGTPLENYLFDNVDLPVQINYMATTCIIQNIDGSDKNHYIYRDTEGSGEWAMLPWDLDLSFGPDALNTDNMVFDEAGTSHPYIGARPHTLNLGAGKYNHFLEVIVANPRTKEMLNRRIRSLIDAHLASGYFHDRIDALVAQIGPDVLLDKAKWGANAHFGDTDYTLQAANDRIKNEYLDPRIPYLTVTEGPGGAGIPASQPAAPAVNFGAVEFNPASGNQDEEFIELANPNAFPVDVSGWTVTGGVDITLRPGTVIPAAGSLYLSPDVTAFRARAASPKGGEGRFVQGGYSGHLSNFGEALVLSDEAATIISQTSTPVAPSDAQLYLVVSEFMYHPAGDPGEEFVELQNISDTVTLDLTGVKFSAGVEFDFTGGAVASLGPGERVLVVRDQAAFEAVHGAGLPVAGEFANASLLDNDGERIKLDDATNSTVRDFTYNDTSPWSGHADGLGPGLVLIDPASVPDHDTAANWRPSSLPGGNPGGSDAVAFSGDPGADLDGNGVPDLIDHALADGGSPVLLPAADGMTFEFILNLAADDVGLALVISGDLVTWSDGAAIFSTVATEYLGDGGLKMIYSAPAAGLPADQVFVRLEASVGG